MRIILAALIRRTILATLPLLLSACLFSVEPVLDETNSTSGEESAEFIALVEASRMAYGDDGIIPLFETKTLSGDLSVIRVAKLENGVFLIQQELRDCISDHCFVYYGARMLETWWPDICLVVTEGDEAQNALSALAAGHGVTVTLISDNRKAPPDFGMDGPRDSQLAFLRAQFTEGELSCMSNEGTTPLHFAAEVGNTETIAALLEAGADVDARDEDGATPLHIAAEEGEAEAVVALIEAGADVDARNSDGSTPLHVAWYDANIAALIEAGADVNARDNTGRTPLHLAAAYGTPANVEALLDAGADGSLQDDDGNTPFDLIKENEWHKFEGTDAYTRLEKARHD